jgi:DNA integrity scanning protein DisA with diadenylate cyclase activity
MADLPKVNPVNIVMESEKYYDFDPSSFQRALPTLKTVGSGIADLVVPQTATEVAMYAIPPVAVYNKVQKILNRAEALKAQARSIYNYVSEFGGSSKQAKIFEKEAKKLIDDIPKKDRKIHDDYEKSLMGTKESNKRHADKARRILANPKKSKGDEALEKAIVAERKKDPSFDDKISYYNYLTIEKNMTDPAKIAEKMKAFVPGKQTKMKKGGLVDKPLYADQKYF